MHSTESHDSVPVALDATLRHLVESTDVGIWHIDTSGFTRYVNRAMCRLLEVESERELRGVHVTEFYSEAMRAHILPEFRKRMQGESSRYEAELTGRRGARHNVLLSGAPVLNGSGDVVGMVATFTDITQWKKSQQALLHQEYKYRLLMEQAGDAIFMNADDGRIEEVNAQACRLLGYSREELLTLRERDLLPAGPAGGHCMCFGEQDNRTIAHRECHMRCKDGALVPVEIGVTPISAQFHLVIVHDITERRRAQDRLLRAARMESIGRLAGGVAHDFNNLLAVISGYSESMLRRVDEAHPLHSHVQEIYRAATRGASLTQQLLAFSRQRSIAPQVIDLSQAVRSVHAMIRRVISDKIDIELRASDPTPIKADPGQIEQVLVNLALNARDAMPEGGRIVIATGIADVADEPIAALPKGCYVRLSVRDTGSGMDADTRAHIFDPFFTTKEQNAEGGGTGLGLSIVYGIVQEAGGAITVRSELGQGSQFDVYFPRATAS